MKKQSNQVKRWSGSLHSYTISVLAKEKKYLKVYVYFLILARHVHGQTKDGRHLTFMGMFVMVVEAKSKCCWTRMLSLVARCRPARTL